jgi:hypothetical protein
VFDWGDGDNSGWQGPVDSGDKFQSSYIWNEEGNYMVKVKVKDIWESESEWSDPFSVTMPKSKPYNDRPLLGFLQNILERFPLLTRLLQLVFNRLQNLQ